MNVNVLSSKGLDENTDYGDCFIIDNGKKMVVYDCGSEEFAKKVIKYMNDRGYSNVDVILSHNDSDHYDGIPYLVEHTNVKSITTLLLFKYADEICERIGDGRKNKKSIIKQISELYDNIFELKGQNLQDAIGTTCITDGIKIVGPDKEYFLEAVSKHLDTRESDNIDRETIMNAISVQVEIEMNDKKMLLTGDANFEAIGDKVKKYDIIQLPHHGKLEQAEAIFEANYGRNNVKYLVSDNKGNAKGGSKDLMKKNSKGRNIENTRNGEINLNCSDIYTIKKGSYNNFAIYNFK